MKYRKKPVVIEAFQMTEERGHDNRDWPAWLNEAWCKSPQEPGAVLRTAEASGGLLAIHTLEGHHLVSWGDWIVRGVQGELYPVKPDIFAATYEPTEE